MIEVNHRNLSTDIHVGSHVIIRLHNHAIVRIENNGDILLSDAGYPTPTTLKHLKKYANVEQKQKKWYVEGQLWEGGNFAMVSNGVVTFFKKGDEELDYFEGHKKPQEADEEIIPYQDIQNYLEEVYGQPHKNSSFFDRGRLSIFCSLPDEIHNDSITHMIYETYDVDDNYLEEFTKDYLEGIRRSKWKSFPMTSVLRVLADNDKILHGSYRIEVSW